MELERLVARMGGVARRSALIAATSRAEVDRALRDGRLVADSRGRYMLGSADDAARLANRLHGVLCRESAALHLGWAVKAVPDKPHVSVPKKRKVAAHLRALVHLHRDDFALADVDGIATSAEVTLAQCLRHLPWDRALTVADSALREGIAHRELERIIGALRGPGAPQARRAAAEARAKAANPFESVLRAIALDVPGLSVEPQVRLRGALRCEPDLVDRRLGLVIEADSFAWHGKRAALRRDARRYNLLVVDGWIVLRFAWEEVMFDQEFVRRVLVAAVALVAERTHCRCCSHRAA